MDFETLAEGIAAGERRALARGLTLVESNLTKHEELSHQLFNALGQASRGFRLGVTGPPGAGKSTLIEKLVLAWVAQGLQVAVLTVDPSSRRTGGSLLGDKTRMGELAVHPRVFVRPSPSGDWLGGLSRKTPLMCSLLERAGYQRIVIETVGVGQSEIGVSYLVDQLLLVALPGAGDEVQGIKRGLMEEIDLVAANKSDLGQAKATVTNLSSAFRVFRRDVPVMPVSALTGAGLESLLAELGRRGDARRPVAQCETHFFDQYSLEYLRRQLQLNDNWKRLRQEVETGRRDLLQSLPQLAEMLRPEGKPQ